VNSFQGEAEPEPNTPDSWDAFAPSGTPNQPDAAVTGWEAFLPDASDRPADEASAARRPTRHEFPAEPAAPTGTSRASFGITDGPISGARPEPVSPAAPDADGPAPFPVAVDLPSAGALPPAADVPPFPVAADTPAEPVRVAPLFARAGSAAAAPSSADVPGGVGDVMDGPGREIRPHRANRDAEPLPQQPERRRSRLVTAATVVLSVVVLLGGAVAGVAFFAGENKSLTSVFRLGSGGSDGKVATAPLDGRTTASFELVAATTKVTVRTQDLGDDLYRITTAGDSGTAPSPVLSNDRVQLLLSPDGEGSSGNVEVLLSTKVTWGLRFVGGADEQIVDLAGGKVNRIAVAGGSRRVDLRLSQPAGTVPIRVTGAVDELSVTSPAGSPVRVKVNSGAKTVAAGDKTLRDVEPGSTLTPKDWKSPNRYDVDAASRVTLLTVRNAP
jgi:hypothetical protein